MKFEEVKKILKSKMALEQCDPDVMPYFTDYYWIPVDQIDEITCQICQLFQSKEDAPKPNECSKCNGTGIKPNERLLSPEDIKDKINEHIKRYGLWVRPQEDKKRWDWDEEIILEAQLAKCDAEFQKERDNSADVMASQDREFAQLKPDESRLTKNPYDNPQDRERDEDGYLSKYEIFEAGTKAQLAKDIEHEQAVIEELFREKEERLRCLYWKR